MSGKHILVVSEDEFPHFTFTLFSVLISWRAFEIECLWKMFSFASQLHSNIFFEGCPFAMSNHRKVYRKKMIIPSVTHCQVAVKTFPTSAKSFLRKIVAKYCSRSTKWITGSLPYTIFEVAGMSCVRTAWKTLARTKDILSWILSPNTEGVPARGLHSVRNPQNPHRDTPLRARRNKLKTTYLAQTS